MLHLSAIYLPIYGMNNQIGLFSRVHPNTHSNTIVVRNGFAWAVRIATHPNTLVCVGFRGGASLGKLSSLTGNLVNEEVLKEAWPV